MTRSAGQAKDLRELAPRAPTSSGREEPSDRPLMLDVIFDAQLRRIKQIAYVQRMPEHRCNESQCVQCRKRRRHEANKKAHAKLARRLARHRANAEARIARKAAA